MTGSGHEHSWGDWKYAGYLTDMRTCTCGSCTGADYRPHRHRYTWTDDVFAPMGSSLTIEVCGGPSGCGDTKRGE
jgi:hypothetical protein